MPSDYFDFSTGRMVPGETARAEDVNAAFDAIESGLDKLPAEDALKRGKVNYVVAGGSANAYTADLAYAPAAYADGMEVVVKIQATNTGSSTINLNSLGAQAIKRRDGSNVVAGDLLTGKIITLRYNTDHFEMEQIAAGNMADVATVAANSANVTICATNIQEIIDAPAYAAAAAASKDDAIAAKDLAEAAAANLPNATTAGADKFLQTNGTADGWLYNSATEQRTALDAIGVGDFGIGLSADGGQITNINTLFTSGIYPVSTTATGTPTSGSSGSVIVSRVGVGGRVSQLFLSYVNARMYRRDWTGTVWDDWVRVVMGIPSSISSTSVNEITTTSHTHAADTTLARSAVTMTAGNGLTGGGNLTANRTLTLGLPEGITATSVNAVTATSHTHNVDLTLARSATTITAGNGLTGGGNLTANRTITLGTPNALTTSTLNEVTTASHTHQIHATTGHSDVTAGRFLRAEDLALVTQAEAEAGTSTTYRRWNPVRVWDAALAAVDAYIEGKEGGSYTNVSPFTSGTIKWLKIGAQVTISWNSMGHPSASNPTTASAIIPAGVRPPDTRSNVYYVESGTGVMYLAEIGTNGLLSIKYLGSGGGAQNKTATLRGHITYIL